MATVQPVSLVILCLGEARRMRPLTDRCAKAFLPFCGRPLVEHTLELLRGQRFLRVRLIVDASGDEYGHYSEWGAARGMDIAVVRRGLEHGSAGVVADLNDDVLGDSNSVLVVYGDSLLDVDFGRFAQAHERYRRLGGEMTMAFHAPSDVRLSQDERSNYGILWLAADGRVVRFVEKPSMSEFTSPHANAGLYLLERSVFERFPKDRPIDFSNDVFPALCTPADSPVFGHDLGTGYRYDIGTIEAYRTKQLQVVAGDIPLPSVDSSRTHDKSTPLNAVILGGRAFIGADCQFGPRVELRGQNVLGDRVSIGAGVVIENSVVLDDCRIGDGACIRDAVLGSGTRVEREAVLGPGAVTRAGSVVGDVPSER